jgi:cytochrome P450
MEMAEPVKIRELKHVDPILDLLEPEARAILAAQGINLDPERPPKPYDFFELVSRVVYGSDEIAKLPFGALLFGRYDDAEAACRNPALGAMGLAGILASGIDAGPLHEVFSSLMFSADGTEHQRLRAPVQAWFMPKAVESCRPAIEACARERLEPLRIRGHGDFFREYADPLALSAALIRLGAPVDHVPLLGEATIAVFHAFFPMTPDAVERAERGVATLGAFADDLIMARRRHPGDDLVTDLLRSADEGRLTLGEVRATIVNLLFGGHDLLRGAIVNAMFTMMRFRDQWDRLVADSTLARTAAEESLRFVSGGAVARMATAATEIRGCPIAAGTMVIAGGPASNRDPAHVTHPHVFDIGRTRSHHFTFGAGDHFCLGASLARLTLEIALATSAAMIPTVELAVGIDEIEWESAAGPPVVVSLPVVVREK